MWGSYLGDKLGFYQLSVADLNRITEENDGGETVAMRAASEAGTAVSLVSLGYDAIKAVQAYRQMHGASMTGSLEGLSMFEPDPREAKELTQYTGLNMGSKDSSSSSE